MQLQSRQLGAVLIILSAFFFTCLQIVVRLSSDDIPLMEQILIRNVISLVFAWWMTWRRRVAPLGPLRHQPALFARSLLGLAGAIAQFLAVSTGTQADTTVIIRMSPFVTCVVAYFFLKERITKTQLAALFTAALGALIVAWPLGGANLFPMTMAMLCALWTGMVYPLLSYLKDHADGYSIIAHFSLVGIVVSLPFLFLEGGFVLPRGRSLLLALLISLFTCLGQICLTFAYRFAPASEVSIYNYTAIPFSMLLGFLALGEPVALQALLGGSLVILAALMVYCSGRRDQPSCAAQAPIPPP
jgi:drug/metabolite transporter (DMT)-like permease